MVDRPYHDYSTSALRELSRDLASSQEQLEDQRADFGKRSGSDDDDLRQLDVLIDKLGHQLAAVDQELATRSREAAVAAAHGPRGVNRRPNHLWAYSSQVISANPKPHCRAKTTGARTPR